MLPEAVGLLLGRGRIVIIVVLFLLLQTLIDLRALNAGVQVLVKAGIGEGGLNEADKCEADDAADGLYDSP